MIIDTGSVYTEWNLNCARAANELLLVTTNELPALQAAQRALSYLDTNRIGRWKIRLVVNRYLRDVGLSREVIGTALHTEVFETLPSDYEAVQKALLDGKPIPEHPVRQRHRPTGGPPGRPPDGQKRAPRWAVYWGCFPSAKKFVRRRFRSYRSRYVTSSTPASRRTVRTSGAVSARSSCSRLSFNRVRRRATPPCIVPDGT